MEFVRRLDLIGRAIRTRCDNDSPPQELRASLVLDVSGAVRMPYKSSGEEVLIIFCPMDMSDEPYGDRVYVAVGSFECHTPFIINKGEWATDESRLMGLATSLGVEMKDLEDTLLGNAPTGNPAEH